jgi:hypothetical protein
VELIASVWFVELGGRISEWFVVCMGRIISGWFMVEHDKANGQWE